MWRTVRGQVADSPFFAVCFWFGQLFRMVRCDLADSPRSPHGQSAWSTASGLSLSLLELCLRVALSRDLFLWLVGPL
jgi:hypothetical protein